MRLLPLLAVLASGCAATAQAPMPALAPLAEAARVTTGAGDAATLDDIVRAASQADVLILGE